MHIVDKIPCKKLIQSCIFPIKVMMAETVKILAYDDDRIILNAYEKILPRIGDFEIGTADNIGDAQEFLRENKPHVALLDYNTEAGYADVFIQDLRPHSPVTCYKIVTADTRPEVVELCRLVDAEWAPKDWDTTNLLNLISRGYKEWERNVVATSRTLDQLLYEDEIRYIRAKLIEHGGNQAQAASALGIGEKRVKKAADIIAERAA